MKKTLLLLCLIAACSDSSGLSNPSTSNQSNKESDKQSSTGKYATEDLLGKTIAEYELFEKERRDQTEAAKVRVQPDQPLKNGFLELTWEDLIAPGYDADSIMEKYNPLIDQLAHGSDEALELYKKMDAEFNNAPANLELADKKVSIPGFIAPLEQLNGMITEFLLVPYFGACIHLPPPPSNQTLYVKVAADYAIRNEDSYEPIWVSGQLNINNKSTDIGSASYQIENALISAYQ